VSHPHGVHIHALDQADIIVTILGVERAAGFGTETVSPDSLQEYALPVEEEPLAIPDFKGSEAKALIDCVKDVGPR
jgi:hypothetical protein